MEVARWRGDLTGESVPEGLRSPCQRAALVYHFFANYRRPILERLESDDEIEFIFAADPKNRLMPGIETWNCRSPSSFRVSPCTPLAGGFMLQRNLIRLALDRNLDSIIFLGDWKWPATWVSALLARRTNKRVLFWTHGWRIPDRQGPKSVLRRMFYSIPHGLLLYGNRARDIAINYGFKPDSLYVVFNSLDHDSHRKLRETLPPRTTTLGKIFKNPNTPALICSSRLRKSKRLEELLEAAHILKTKNDHCVNIILVGDGEARSRLEDLANRFDLSVHFEGACYDETRIAELTSACHATVVPGALGLTAIQSLTFGVPVITNDNWGIQGPEAEAVIDGVTGAIYPYGDVQSLAMEILNFTQVPLRAATRSRCMEIVDRFYNPDFQALVIKSALRGEPAKLHTLSGVY